MVLLIVAGLVAIVASIPGLAFADSDPSVEPSAPRPAVDGQKLSSSAPGAGSRHRAAKQSSVAATQILNPRVVAGGIGSVSGRSGDRNISALNRSAVFELRDRSTQPAASITASTAESTASVHPATSATPKTAGSAAVAVVRRGPVESVLSALFKILGLVSSAPDAPPENPIVSAVLAWSRRVDSFLSVLFPAPPDHMGSVVAGGTLSGSALALWSNMDPGTGDKLTAQLVQGSDEVPRLVVSMTGMRDNLSAALLGNTGWLDPAVSDFIDTAYEDWGLASETEIMLVGFSNGGQQMQNYAAVGKYRDRVTVLLLFGAPLTRTADEIAADSLLIQDLGDKTYALYTHADAVNSYDGNDLDRKTIFSTGKVLSTDTHTLPTYRNAAIEFDNWLNGPNSRDDWAATGNDIRRFSGVVIRSPRTTQITGGTASAVGAA
jgi:hypothetical protein